MKILYAIQGTGNGHLSRAVDMIPELKKYAIVYTAFSGHGPGVALAFTEDFRKFEKLGMIMPPEDKDAALLPYQIDGQWVLIHRPVIGGIKK